MTIRTLVWLLFILLSSRGVAAPLGTAFSYQGRLLESGAPANGHYDLQFALFTSEAGVSLSAGPLTNTEVTISNGVFTALLDFGTNVFSGAGCWLEIAVRPAAAHGNFT